jgi:hypothetical protein
MTPTMELPRLWQWLYGVLSADAAVSAVFGTRLYRGGLAPPTATYPLLLFMLRAGVDANCLGPSRAALDALVWIRGIAPPTQYLSHLAPGLDAVEAALWGRDDVQAGYRFQVVAARGPVEYEDPPASGLPVYTHLGRDWEISVYPQAA